MTCRHRPGDPSCSSSPEGQARAAQEAADYRKRELEDRTPDPDKYEILEVEEIGPILIMKVRYPTCVKCSYNGTKILVYKGVSLKDVVKWRRIDPHFSDPKDKRRINEAPSPESRFPASPEGWKHALDFARFLNGGIP